MAGIPDAQDKKSSDDILSEIAYAKERIRVGARYAHYKNPDNTYTVEGFATREEDNVLCVIYKADYGAKLTFMRPTTAWYEMVTWQGSTVTRFTEL